MKRKFSIDIVFIFTLLIVITVSGIVALVYYQSRATAIESARNQFVQQAEVLTKRTDSYMRIAQQTAEIATEIFKRPDLALSLESDEASYLLKALKAHRQIALIYYGKEDGSFLQAGDIGGKIYTKVIHQKGDKADTVYHYYDQDGNIIQKKTIEDSKYDPRLRPWYRDAKKVGKVFWTDPYIFFSNGRPGITVAVPIFTEEKTLSGVVAADITLDGLSDFLKDVDLSKNGIAFITDNQGNLVAFSGEKAIIVTENGKARSLKPSELAIQQVNAAIAAHGQHNEKLLSCTSQGKEYLAAFLPFPESFGKKWTFTILAPEDDFTGAMKTTLRRILYLSIAGLIIGILMTMLLSRRVSKPIELLAQDVLEVRHFNLDTDSGVKSHIHEIQTMDNAIKAMKNSLKAFRLYVPRLLVKQLIQSGEKIAVGGQERELTLFFSDIANFTTITEKSDPKEIMLQLSEYLEAATVIMEDEKGTIDKFVGDGIVAFWGAPLHSDTHAFGACSAALKCQRRIAELNEKWVKEGKDPFHTRIGIHTGSVIVGNIGSEQRMNYTVLGDGVNLTGRLEGVNKIYKTRILISHSTYEQVKDLFVCRILDQIAVKGKSESIRIYELLTEHDAPDADACADFARKFEQIFELYLQRQWQEAKNQLIELRKSHPDDYVSQLYLERCEQLLQQDPGESWDGISRLDFK